MRFVGIIGPLLAGLFLGPLRADEGRNASPYAQQVVASLPAFRPAPAPAGVIRLWGHGSFSRPFMRLLVARWARGFARFHPDITIREETYGTSSAIPALALGAGDLAILGEEILPEAVDTFRRVKLYEPFSVEIANGSVDVRNFDYAQMFFVHKDNPLAQLTLTQLDAIFGAEHRRGAPRNFRTWGDVGLTGEWADKPITPYGWRTDDSFGFYLEQTLLAGSHRWNSALREFRHINRPDGSIYDHGQQALDGLAQDRYGIAVSNIRYAGPDVKALKVAEHEGAPYVAVTARTLIDHTYPLSRTIPAFLDRAPGQPVEPKVKEFLRYILSREGQQDIVDDGRYLPLAPAMVAAQLKKLE
ncbi:substrate-binding domain-containing protein [Opitutus sp. GAS368]|uniref:PstS family phosphate ABC transporter substrate-binding protein n=1 Tax=Opitutus sp. GAS368 TaxID=1882749 RepID=UPI00087AE5A3|nr:substrate-binding domain-containing protein [Opitutus sp. GAS368]SDR90533.1 phosphate transport system substrate-binding protein [Opitutus sp. GAS368]